MRALFVLACCVVTTVGAGDEWHTAEQTCGDDDEECMPHKTTMLLQTHYHVERTEPVSILESCPFDKFQSSLAWLLENKLFLESNVTNSAQTRYLELAEQKQCEVGPEWYVSQKPLIVNVGDGSTATRWLDGVMQDLGFNTHHYDTGGPSPLKGHAGIQNFSRTSSVDLFEYISDTPTSGLTWQLLQSHPNALFLMTMRDPLEWEASRVDHHTESPDLTQGLPCGGLAPLLDANNPAAQTYVAYSAWAKCVIPQDRFIGAVNVFAGEKNDAEFIEKLLRALETHGLQKPDWENRTAQVRARVKLPHFPHSA